MGAAAKNMMSRGVARPASRIIAVGGGKGGVGKSFVSSGLGLFLSHLGYKTLLIDLDLGAANLHTYLGEKPTPISVNEFVSKKGLSFEQLISNTAHPNLKLISGASESLNTPVLDQESRSRLMSSIFWHPSDFIILDLSAGTHDTTLDFFAMAQERMVVITPEPVSIENAYRFMKMSYHRRIRRFQSQLGLNETMDSIMKNRGQYGVRYPADLLNVVKKEEPAAGTVLHDSLADYNFSIVLNQLRSPKDASIGPGIQTVANRFFGNQNSYLGHIEHDNAVWQSLRQRRHLVLENPQSRVYSQLMSISRRVASPQSS